MAFVNIPYYDTSVYRKSSTFIVRGRRELRVVVDRRLQRIYPDVHVD